MDNIKDLRNELITTFKQLKSGKIGLSQAKQEASVANVIIATAKVQLESNKYMKSKQIIKFLDSDE